METVEPDPDVVKPVVPPLIVITPELGVAEPLFVVKLVVAPAAETFWNDGAAPAPFDVATCPAVPREPRETRFPFAPPTWTVYCVGE
jgi:hypothetical protein